MNLEAAYARHGSIREAAAAAGMSRSTFHRKLKAARQHQAAQVSKSAPRKPGRQVLHDDGRLLEYAELPEQVLVWSCTQAPYHHPDALAFLATVKASHSPGLIVCAGDEADLQFLKYARPDSMSPGAELAEVQRFVRDLGRIFPEMVLLSSNHVDERIGYARGKGNLPAAMLRTWPDLIDAPPGWTWRDFLICRNWLFEHGHLIGKGSRGSIAEETIKRFRRPLSIMRGHHHSEFGEHIKPVWINAAQQIRLCYAGCLMDRREVGYTRAPTMLGCVMLIRGVPHPIPMITGKDERWIGKLPEW